MIVTSVSTIEGVRIHVKNSILPDGKEFPNAGSFGYARNPLDGGATEGAAPDGRQLPEWVEFSWKEPPNLLVQKDLQPGPPEAIAEENARVAGIFKLLPIKTQRVLIRSRVPQDIEDEVMESNRRKQPGSLADKALRIYFIWTEEGIKFHWRLWYRPEAGPSSYPREGGDEIQAR
jgi:hypothetical protein